MRKYASNEDSFWAKVEKSDGCWTWKASRNNSGYGCFCDHSGKRHGAHRWAYEQSVGPIPSGLELDHLCRNRSCVRPDHLEPVTRTENTRRGESIFAEEARRTHCPQGHAYTEENTYRYKGLRYCKECRRAHVRRWHHERTKTALGIPKVVRRGSDVHNAKLTAEDVLAIRRRAGSVAGRALAKEYGVSEATICNIIKRKQWAHLPEEAGQA